ncbi:MAG: DNA polymerase III subunit [Candidatus Moranbacteria bacterium]|nr:DNA polymerase III subunit [Candidatus Moranbacteria bacterium]
MIESENINKVVWSRLARIYKQNRVSGAYLFIGPRGLGKLDLAFNFMELDEKLKGQRKLIETGAHPDVILVRPQIEEKKGKTREKQISIDQVKQALKMFSYYPQEAIRKFLVIDSIDKLTLNAANSLLKTIEELSGDYIVILTASGEGGVLDTIKSRCQRVYFNLKSENEIHQFLKKQDGSLDEKILKSIVFLARGRVKEAKKFLVDSDYRERRLGKLEEFKKALRGDLRTGFQVAHDEAKDRQIFSEYLVDWIYYLNSFLKQNIFEARDIRVQKKVFQISRKLNEAREILRSNQNVNARLLLENFFVQIK